MPTSYFHHFQTTSRSIWIRTSYNLSLKRYTILLLIWDIRPIHYVWLPQLLENYFPETCSRHCQQPLLPEYTASQLFRFNNLCRKKNLLKLYVVHLIHRLWYVLFCRYYSNNLVHNSCSLQMHTNHSVFFRIKVPHMFKHRRCKNY